MRFITRIILGFLIAGCFSDCSPDDKGSDAYNPINVVLITADDLNYNSVGVYGCPIPDITPNIDRLAGQGIRFTHAYVNISICQPSRQSMMTGRYPHRTGALAFDPIDRDVPTLQEQLNSNVK